MLNRKFLLTFIFLGFLNYGYSQENKELLKLSVSEAQTYALQNNRTIQAAKLDVSSMDKQIWESIATGLPQLNFAANYQHQFVIPQLSLGPVLDINSLPDGVIYQK